MKYLLVVNDLQYVKLRCRP